MSEDKSAAGATQTGRACRIADGAAGRAAGRAAAAGGGAAAAAGTAGVLDFADEKLLSAQPASALTAEFAG